MKSTKHIVFCTSCRIALGKLRRVTNIVEALRSRNREVEITLLANAGPRGVHKGLTAEEVKLYDTIETMNPGEMAGRLRALKPDLTVVGTMVLRDLHTVTTPLCLLLREVMADTLRKFRLKDGRPWDLVVMPHPEGHWSPDPAVLPAKRVEAVGWIYRQPRSRSTGERRDENGPPTLLVTTGGGSGEDRGNDVRTVLAELIRGIRDEIDGALRVVQVVGPRDWKKNLIEGVDETLKPGPSLHDWFGSVDLVISAVGYNSVLELACTDVSVLLVPVPRYTDDQEARANAWSDALGSKLDPSRLGESVAWAADVLTHRRRRPPVAIGPSGADRCAKLIESLLA